MLRQLSDNETRGLLLGLVAMAVFSLTLPATRVAVAEIDPVLVGLGRAVLAAIVGGIMLIAARQTPPPRKYWKSLTACAFGVVIGFPLFSALAMQSVPASHGGVMLGLLPLATACAGVVVARERPSLGFWASAAAGSAAVIAFALREGGGALRPADWLLLLALMSAAVGYALGGELAKTLGGWQVICWTLIASLPFIAPPVLWKLSVAPPDAGPRAWLGFLYVALFSQLIAFFAWNRALALGGVARVGQTQLLQPFLTIFFAAILLGETVDMPTIGFAVLVVAVVAIGRRTRISRR
jgi:drug/metabolite transporter (DMT)-like permease